MVYGDFKDLNKRTAADKLKFNIAKNPKYDGYRRGTVSMIYKLFNKRASGGTVRNEIISNKELPEELNKPILRKFK